MVHNIEYPVFLFNCQPDDAQRIAAWLAQTPFADVRSANTHAELAEAHGLIIADFSEHPPDHLPPLAQRLPVIALTSTHDADWTLEAGAWDYLPKAHLSREALLRSLRYAASQASLVQRMQEGQRELRASESRFRSLIARNSDGIVVVDSEGVICFVNPAAETLFGRSSALLLRSPLGFPVSAGETTDLEVLQRSGEIATVEMRVVETEWEGIPAFLLSLRDFTERRRTEQALSQAVRVNYQFAAAIASFTVGVVITDPSLPDNPVVFVNAGFTRITGYTAQETIGRNCRFLQGPDTDPVMLRQIAQAIAELRSHTCTLLNYRKDGTPFWNELTINPVFDDEGRLINFVGLQMDVTVRRQAEQALLEQERLRVALEKEKELSQVKNSFMSTVSHEFRTPLAVIQSASDLLDRYHEQMTSEQRHERLENIRAQVRHLEDMLDEISVIVRAELKRLDFQPVMLDVKHLCQTVIEEVRSTIGVSHRFVFAAEHGVYEMPVDPKLLRHILSNLLSNAVKYSRPHTEIRFELFFQAADVVFRIHDQGIGIPRHDQARLFEAFYRASNVEAISGTGLGLKVVKDCVTLHGGSISIESEEGRGTVCTVTLPRGLLK